jgi:hypothetical protein
VNAVAVAVVLEAAKNNCDVAHAGFRLAWDQLRGDRADGLPACVQRARFDEISAAVRELEAE